MASWDNIKIVAKFLRVEYGLLLLLVLSDIKECSLIPGINAGSYSDLNCYLKAMWHTFWPHMREKPVVAFLFCDDPPPSNCILFTTFMSSGDNI